MKCGHCSADVPPQWVHALNTNTCPSCGFALMSDTEVSLLGELREAMNDMPNNPEGIAGWLLTHYQLVKTGSGEAAQFNQPMIHGTGGIPGGLVHQKNGANGAVVGQRIPQPESPVATINKFLARANVKPKSKSEMEAALSRSEGGGGNAALIAAWNSEGGAGDSGEPMDDQVAVYANALAGGGGMGGGMGGGDEGDAAHDAIVNAFAGMGPGGVPNVPGLPGGGRPSGADMLAGIKAMQRKQVNQEMRATGSVGKINRAG